MDRYFVHTEPGDPSGVALTVEGLPRLLIFAETGARNPQLTRAREAIDFQVSGGLGIIDRPPVELLQRDARDALRSPYHTSYATGAAAITTRN